MEQKMDYFTKKMNESVYQSKKSIKPRKRWVSYLTFFVVIVVVFVLVFIFFKKSDNIKTLFVNNEWQAEEMVDGEYKIWQLLNLSGGIFSDWDLISYTHTIRTNDWEIFWLKSRTIDLNSYRWNLQIYWIIEKLVWDIFVIEVNNIFSDEIVQENVSNSTWRYISEAWIFFGESFFDKYLVSNVSSSNISLKNLDNNQNVDISYFRCNTSNSDQNCRLLNETFSKTSEKDFTTSNWVIFYKLQSMNSRYFSNNNLFWYFINDVLESELIKLSDYIVLPNRLYVDYNIIPNISRLCVKDGVNMASHNSYDIILENNKLLVSIQWSNISGKVNCKLVVDPLSLFKANLQDIKFEVEEKNEKSEKLDEDTSSFVSNVLVWDPNVKQFPINLDNTMEFISSTRWYKMIFPSKNIAFVSTNVEYDFGQLWVNCFIQMNVVSYPNKEKLNIEPAIKIYECNIRNWFEESEKTIFRKIWDRNFIIEVIDPSWIEFANNLEIQVE